MIINKLNTFLFSTKEAILFVIQILVRPYKTERINLEYKESVIIGNGPSAIHSLEKGTLKGKNVICFNDFSTTEYFQKFKPNQYFLIDPYFFGNSHRNQLIFKEINSVNWSIFLCVPAHHYKRISKLVTNDKVKLVRVTVNSINMTNKLAYLLYSNGFAMPKAQNVSVAALILNMSCGVLSIELHGMEHNWPNLMVLNRENELCLHRTHFFDDDQISIWRRPDGKIWRVSESLMALSIMFRSYEIIDQYAKYSKVRIVNKTPNTLIDAFERS